MSRSVALPFNVVLISEELPQRLKLLSDHKPRLLQFAGEVSLLLEGIWSRADFSRTVAHFNSASVLPRRDVIHDQSSHPAWSVFGWRLC